MESARQFGRGAAAHGDHLGGDGNGDLLRRNGADIEPMRVDLSNAARSTPSFSSSR